MTEDSARTIANVVLGAAAVGAAYVVISNPPLRRLAWRLAVLGVTRKLPQWLSTEIQHAWKDSGKIAGAEAPAYVRRPAL